MHLFNPPLQLLSLIQDGAALLCSTSWRDILMDMSCQTGDEHCLGARGEIETLGNIANPLRTLLVPLVGLTSRNAGSAERWSRTELSGSEESLPLLSLVDWENWPFCSSALTANLCYTCLPHSRYQQSGFLSLRPKNSAFSSRFNVNPCSNLKMSPWNLLEHKSFYRIAFCHGCEMLSSPVPLSCV